MKSILRQLTKYQPAAEEAARQVPSIEIKHTPHPYEKIVRSLCDCTDHTARETLIGDALVGLNDFVPPPMVDQLYPIELAILYHLFYRHKLLLCSESVADAILHRFIKLVAERDGGLDVYMSILKNMLDKTATMIFLYRVMLASFGARGKWDKPMDRVNKQFGLKASQAMGVPATAKIAANGLDSLTGAEVEQLILGRITYIAFWHWSQQAEPVHCQNYLALPPKVL